jgi:hypothetical protein
MVKTPSVSEKFGIARQRDGKVRFHEEEKPQQFPAEVR